MPVSHTASHSNIMDSVFHHLLPLLLACLLFSTAPAASWVYIPIHDSDGNQVIAGARYYVTTPLISEDFGLAMGSPNGSCPLNLLVQTWIYGPPVMLFPTEVREFNVVYVGDYVNIMFARTSECADSTQWKFDTNTDLVTTGGALSNSEVNFNHFVVNGHGISGLEDNIYEFLSCPAPGIRCIPLGPIGDDRLLGKSTTPLAVKFVKVPEKLVGSASMRPTA